MNKKFITGAFSLSLIFSSSSSYVYASTSNNFEKEKNELNQSIQKATSQLDQNSELQKDIQTNITSTSSRIQDLEMEIYEQTSRTLELDKDITTLQETLKEIERNLEIRVDYLKNRAVALQVNDPSNIYIEVLFGSESFSDLVSRIVSISTIVDADKELIDSMEKDKRSYESTVSELEQKIKELNESTAELNTLRTTLEEEKKNYEEQKANIDREQQKLKEQIMTNQKKLEEITNPQELNKNLGTVHIYDYDVRNVSDVTPEQINALLMGKLKGYGQTYYDVGHRYGIDPAFLAAVSMAETGGTAIDDRNNVGGLMKSSGGKMSFSSIEECINYMGLLFTNKYINDGLITVEAIHTRYSPDGASNDPTNLNANWVNNVYKFMVQAGVQINS